MQPLEGARVLVLSADASAIEPLAAGLEEDGAEVIFRFSPKGLPEPDSLDAVVVDESAGGFEQEALWRYLESVPDDVLVLDTLEGAREALLAELTRVEPATGDSQSASPAAKLGLRRDPRLTRAALTVIGVTGLVWLISRWQQATTGDLPPATPQGPQTGGQAELAGRVTRSTTGEGLAGAAVVASGPSGSMTTVTDGQGRWRFADLRGGRYVVMSTAPRYVAKQQQVDVPEGRAIENVNFSLDPEAP